MAWVVGGNYANGSYAGLAYVDWIQKARAKNLELAFIYSGIACACDNQPEGISPLDVSKEEEHVTKRSD